MRCLLWMDTMKLMRISGAFSIWRHLEKGMIEYTAAGGGKVSRCSVLGSLHK